jgi:hypothetical protein
MNGRVRFVVGIACALLLAAPASGEVTYFSSWESPWWPPILGFYGNLCCESRVSGVQVGSQGSTLPDYECPGASHGYYYLHVAEDPHSGTPAAYIAWIVGLSSGDFVRAGFFGYDITPGAAPSLRIWASYTETGGEIWDYAGSAGGNANYTAGTGWEQMQHAWVFADEGGLRDGLVVEARLYSTPTTSNPDHTDFWIDYVWVIVPEQCTVYFPGETSVPVGISAKPATWSRIKYLYLGR